MVSNNMAPFCVDMNSFDSSFIKNLSSDVSHIKVIGNYKLSKSMYDDLVVYTNVDTIDVYDVDDFIIGNDIKINVNQSVLFNSDRYKKFNINKIYGYNKDSLTISLPFKLFFNGDYLYSEEDDFDKLLNYIRDIEILNINFDDINVIDDVISVVYKIEEKINKKIKFINCVCSNKTIYNIEKLRFLEDDRIIRIWYEEGISDCTVSEFITMRKNIDSIVSDVLSKNLSNFEKVIYVYDIAKKFNYSCSSDNYSMDGRQLHKIFNTGKIVCSGYSRIVTQVLNELGIRSGIYKLITKDNILHARSLVHIVDDTYNINYVFSMEPTWESALNEDYAYSLFLTPINRLKEYFPKERFREDIDVLCGNKKISDICLRDRISLYQFFDNKDLNQYEIDMFLSSCNKGVDLNSFCKALVNVRMAQGISEKCIVSNVSNVIKYNSELSSFLNKKMGTNISFFS